VKDKVDVGTLPTDEHRAEQGLLELLGIDVWVFQPATDTGSVRGGEDVTRKIGRQLARSNAAGLQHTVDYPGQGDQLLDVADLLTAEPD
jgi:hypothetical protein